MNSGNKRNTQNRLFSIKKGKHPLLTYIIHNTLYTHIHSPSVLHASIPFSICLVAFTSSSSTATTKRNESYLFAYLEKYKWKIKRSWKESRKISIWIQKKKKKSAEEEGDFLFTLNEIHRKKEWYVLSWHSTSFTSKVLR